MILTASQLIDIPVMGLQTSSELARTTRAIINPANLEILAYELKGPLLKKDENLLRIADVRELSDIGLIVDSAEEFINPDDVIKLAEIYKLNFELLGMPVIDERHHKLGRINGYTVDTVGFVVQQLSVKRPLLKSLNDTELLIHRSQITEINDHEIIIHSETETPEPTTESLRTSYANPFRKTSPEVEHIDEN